LINDILDLSKIEADKVTVDRTPCSVWQIVDDVVNLTELRAKEKGLCLSSQYAYPLPETIQIDPIRLRQILLNLVSNAVKFTDRGEVQIAVSLLVGRRLGCKSRVRYGNRHPPDAMTKLFQAFGQVDSSPHRRHQGTGLGLAISRRLAEMLGGDISVTSKPGEGSTFTVALIPAP